MTRPDLAGSYYLQINEVHTEPEDPAATLGLSGPSSGKSYAIIPGRRAAVGQRQRATNAIITHWSVIANKASLTRRLGLLFRSFSITARTSQHWLNIVRTYFIRSRSCKVSTRWLKRKWVLWPRGPSLINPQRLGWLTLTERNPCSPSLSVWTDGLHDSDK